jgi:hypothetical protein
MTAASVTGIGQGSADKAGQKGSEHLFVGVEKLVGTRIVLSGVGLSASHVATVVFPAPLPGVATDYAIFLTLITATGSAQGIHLTAVPGVLTLPTQSGTETSGSPTITGLTSTYLLTPGMSVTGTGIPASTTILSVNSTTSITLSANATDTGAETLTFGATGTFQLAGFSVYTDESADNFFWQVVRVTNASVGFSPNPAN